MPCQKRAFDRPLRRPGVTVTSPGPLYQAWRLASSRQASLIRLAWLLTGPGVTIPGFLTSIPAARDLSLWPSLESNG